MKRKTILYFIFLVMTLSIMGCSEKEKEPEPTKVVEVTPTEKPAEEKDESQKGEVEDESKKKKGNKPPMTLEKVSVSNDSVLISSLNTRTVTSTIPVEAHPILNIKEIDDALQAELDSGLYTFEEPLIVVDPYQNSPLTAVVLFQTDVKAGVRVTVSGSTDLDNVTGEVQPATSHRVPVIGLYAGRENQVLLQLMDEEGNEIERKVVSIMTDQLPEKLLDAVRVEDSNDTSVYNLTYVSGQASPYAFAYDRSGEIRWYLSMSVGGYGILPLSNHRFIFQPDELLGPTLEKPHTVEFYEMDYLGRIYMMYYVENGYHHEVIEKTPGGNLLVLGNSIDEHVEDRVLELDRETGEVVKTLDMTEIFGKTYVDMVDWAHLNTVSYDEESDCIILSPRNIHSGIKVNWTTNELIWILCNPKFWKGTPFEDKVLKGSKDIIWHYQQHTVYQLKEDLDNDPDTIHVMMYDNHWQKTRKVKFFDKLKSSYVTLYTINEKEMTVTQDHIYEGVKSKITSNFTLEYDEKRVFSMGGCLDPVIDGRKGMIYEFDYDTEEVVNQYSLKYTFYRAYEMIIDYDDLAKPLVLPENYQRGRLRAPVKSKKIIEMPVDTVSGDVEFLIRGDILYVKANDHSINQIEFLSEGKNYIYDLTYTVPTYEYEHLKYNIGIPLQKMKAGTYKIALGYIDAWYNSGHEVTIE